MLKRQLLKAPDYPEPGDKIRYNQFPWTLLIETFDENKEIAFAAAEDCENTVKKYKLPLSRLDRIEPHCWHFSGARPQR